MPLLLRMAVTFCLLLAFVSGCDSQRSDWVPPRPKSDAAQAPHTRQAIHKGHPKIDGQGVRDWFGNVSLPGWRRLSIFSEFHPDEGSFVARYGKGQKVLYLSYIDNQRMSQFGLKRSAREILQTGRAGLPESRNIEGRTWYAVKDSRPLLATDVTRDVKLVLMGYQGLSLDDLVSLAPQLPVDALQKMAEG